MVSFILLKHFREIKLFIYSDIWYQSIEQKRYPSYFPWYKFKKKINSYLFWYNFYWFYSVVIHLFFQVFWIIWICST